MQIFNGLGWLLGYVLYGLYFVVRNYGVAVILFTVVLNLLMFPPYIKQQKGMAGSMKMQKKMQELQKIYGNDKAKLMEEQQKLYEKEGMGGMGSSCLMMVIPMLIFMSLFYSLSSPLTNMLHLNTESLAQVSAFMENIPGNPLASTLGSYASTYHELDLAKNFSLIQPYVAHFFSAYDLQKLTLFSHSFMFFGLDLLRSPAVSGQFWQTLFSSPLFLLPFASIALQIISTIYMTYSQKKMGQAQPGAQQGCMTVLMVGMSLPFGYLTCILPAAMGLYYTINGLMGLFRTWLMQKFYSPQILTAQAEGAHVLLMEQKEAGVKPLAPEVQAQLETKLRNWNQTAQTADAAKKKKGAKSAQAKKIKDGAKNKADYMGQKK
ncbi:MULTISPECIES: YidC/Oxa1 family membrane protein insertase [Caproicibacterium]|uniref:YidC/Oxa1 family membrane protein insertase n=1 Tax=Caproicibacterium argilliputei TaxID=3030016 RepID=A0AA97DAG3_9FIRM|nr:YidC/Oxa1 family membrane protein insertase [Caproicibacterium argilliputei]WOC32279.1 YidC/Oxa1 family membrane protein insertase [Caproicibacterium argilliputei]